MDIRDAKRVTDLKAARKRVKPDDVLSLDHVAQLWGVSKPRFVTVMKEMVGFPAPKTPPKEMGLSANSHVYAAIGAIDAMLAFAARHETSAKAKAARTARILGRPNDEDDGASVYSPNEFATLSRVQADVQDREREQGLYVEVAALHVVAGDVFAEIAEFCAGLSNAVDPHGELPPEHRSRIAERAKEAQLRVYRRMKHILAPDAVVEGNRDKARRAGGARARR